jgi:hypothetical protein
MQLNVEPLDALPLWAFFAIAVAVALLALEIGYRLGRWRHARAVDEQAAPVGAMVASILGLLAFMLAFTFGLASSRFDARSQVMLEEANAIGTTYLRAHLLAERERSRITKLLREYVDVRVRTFQEGIVAEGRARSEQLHEQLWSQATAAAQKNPGSIMTGLFIQSLNEVIGLHGKRLVAALRNRIPLSIWITLFTLAVFGMVSTGCQAGLSATRRSREMLLLAMSFAAVLFLIVDLDRTHEGFLRVNQQAMLDLQKSMQAPPTEPR